MKLEAKAKPIRIRIKIGNEEHSNLDSLKRKFDIEEIVPLLSDGRFLRWLVQIGEVEKAKQLETFSFGNPMSLFEIKTLLSIFFEEIDEHKDLKDQAIAWADNGNYKEVSAKVLRYMVETDYEVAKYCYLNSILTDVAWNVVFKKFLTIDIVKELYDSEKTHKVFLNNWGEAFASVVKNEEDFSIIIEYILDKWRNKGKISGIAKFKEKTLSSWNSWISNLKFEDLRNLLSIIEDKKLVQDWDKQFAKFTDSKNFEIIERLIKSNLSNKEYISFCEICAKTYDIKDAYKRLDPWSVLKHHEDKAFVIKALNEWDGDYRHYDKDQYNYSLLKNDLAIEMLGFLEGMINLRGREGSWYIRNPRKIKKSSLDAEQYIIELVAGRYRDRYSNLTFDNFSYEKMEEFRDKGYEIAHQILEHRFDSYMDIAYMMVSYFKSKLK